MKEFLVKWEMTIEAESFLDAAKKALEIHRDPESVADVFNIIDTETCEEVTIDTDGAVYDMSPYNFDAE